jgi:hypothetical protein
VKVSYCHFKLVGGVWDFLVQFSRYKLWKDLLLVVTCFLLTTNFMVKGTERLGQAACIYYLC